MKIDITLNHFIQIVNNGGVFENFIFGENIRAGLKDELLNINQFINDKEKNIELHFTGCDFSIVFWFTNMLQNITSITFKDCIFSNKVNFGSTRFKLIKFYECTFNKPCIFYRCEFNDKISFDDVTFNDLFLIHTSRGQVIKINEAYFRCNFNGRVEISDVSFGFANFSHSTFGDKSIVFANCDFNLFGIFRKTSLRENFVFLNTIITKCSFLNSDFEKANIVSSNIDANKLIDIAIFKEPEKHHNEIRNIGMYNADEIISEVNASSIISELRVFEKNFDNAKRYDISGEFHKKCMEIDKEFNSTGFKKIILMTYGFFSDYGENYKKTLCFFMGTILLFSFIYILSGIVYIGEYPATVFYLNPSNIFNFFNDISLGFLFSVVNSFPVKKELDFLKAANGFTIAFTIIQTTIQSILITLSIIALRRKFKR